MFIPPNHTKEEVLAIIQDIAKRLSSRFKFGYHEAEDIEQDVFILLIKKKILEKYDNKRPLAGFLYTAIKNSLFNNKRDNFTKKDPPCLRCPLKAYLPPDGCSAYADKLECRWYHRWYNNNTSKFNIMHTINIDNVSDVEEDSMSYSKDFLDEIRNTEIHNVLLKSLSTKNRKFYLMLLNNCNIKSQDLECLKEEIAQILIESRRNVSR